MGEVFHLKSFETYLPTIVHYETIPRCIFCVQALMHLVLLIKTSIIVININWILQPLLFEKNDKNYDYYFFNVHWVTVCNNMDPFIFISRETCCFSHILNRWSNIAVSKWIEIIFIHTQIYNGLTFTPFWTLKWYYKAWCELLLFRFSGSWKTILITHVEILQLVLHHNQDQPQTVA